MAIADPRTAESWVPTAYRDLLKQPMLASLSTLMPDGYVQTHPVWFDFDGQHLCINTMRGFRKERNMRADPRVTLLVVDPVDPGRWIEVRGLAQLIDEDARAHLDGLAWRYAGVHHYFGEVVPAEFAVREIPVIAQINPLRVVTDILADPRSRRVCNRPVPPDVTVPLFRGGPVAVAPDSHRDLLVRCLPTVLSTRMPGGHPQTQPVWCDFDGCDVRVNTTRERQKGRNLQANPRATVLIVDPGDQSRWIEIRGKVDITEVGALDHLDRLTRDYTGKPHYYGGIYPLDWRGKETRIICRIHPRNILCDAIHR